MVDGNTYRLNVNSIITGIQHISICTIIICYKNKKNNTFYENFSKFLLVNLESKYLQVPVSHNISCYRADAVV